MKRSQKKLVGTYLRQSWKKNQYNRQNNTDLYESKESLRTEFFWISFSSRIYHFSVQVVFPKIGASNIRPKSLNQFKK